MRIIFVRHGLTEANLRKAYLGRADESLCAKGISQLMELEQLEILRNMSTLCREVYVSSRKRTKESAKILFPTLAQREIPDFDEMDFGDFEQKNYIDLENSTDYQRWIDTNCETTCPNGEKKSNFIARCSEAFLRTVNENAEDKFFVVHGGTIMSICSIFVKNSTYFQWNISCGDYLEFYWNGNELEKCLD